MIATGVGLSGYGTSSITNIAIAQAITKQLSTTGIGTASSLAVFDFAGDAIERVGDRAHLRGVERASAQSDR
jgi:hypothetical protein